MRTTDWVIMYVCLTVFAVSAFLMWYRGTR